MSQVTVIERRSFVLLKFLFSKWESLNPYFCFNSAIKRSNVSWTRNEMVFQTNREPFGSIDNVCCVCRTNGRRCHQNRIRNWPRSNSEPTKTKARGEESESVINMNRLIFIFFFFELFVQWIANRGSLHLHHSNTLFESIRKKNSQSFINEIFFSLEWISCWCECDMLDFRFYTVCFFLAFFHSVVQLFDWMTIDYINGVKGKFGAIVIEFYWFW